MNNDNLKDQTREEMKNHLKSGSTPREIVGWFGQLEQFSDYMKKHDAAASDEDIAAFWEELKLASSF